MRAKIFQTLAHETLFCQETYPIALFFGAIGFEPRSVFLLEKLLKIDPSVPIIPIFFKDYLNYDIPKKYFEFFQSKFSNPIIGDKEDLNSIIIPVERAIDQAIVSCSASKIIIEVDYSSMPRRWYCGLINHFAHRYKENIIFRFWYSEGCYLRQSEIDFPTAGISQFEKFSGLPSIEANRGRIHLLGIGFDSIRTMAISTVLDPSYLVACYACHSNDIKMAKKIINKNAYFLDTCSYHFGLSICDFQSMLSHLIEFVREMTPMGDIIIVPDGPKPLILAMSLLPNLFLTPGISCYHVTGSTPPNIKVNPTKNVFGFSFNGQSIT